jgi:hypothetical protein
MMTFHLIAGLVCGVAAALIASTKGRNVVGWFFGGLLIGLIGVIIVACLSNLKKQRAQQEAATLERHRLREQLRQERIKSESFRRYSTGRLDAHDQALEIDTRSTPAALPGADPQSSLQAEPQGDQGEAALQRMASGAQAPSTPAFIAPVQWYYESQGQTCGPVEEGELRSMMRSGQLRGNTLLWKEGFAEWTPANRVETFRPEVPS